MGKTLRLGFVLAVITIIASFGLSMLYKQTKPQIEKIKMEKIFNALSEVMPDAKTIETISKKEPIFDPTGKEVATKELVEYYIGYKDSTKKEIAGYALKASKPGYETNIETIFGIDTNGTIKKIVIIDQKETPGLGARCTESQAFDPNNKRWTTQQFIGKTVNQLKVDKDGGEIISITGATITSRAVTGSLKDKLQEFLPKIEKNSQKENSDSVEKKISEKSGE